MRTDVPKVNLLNFTPQKSTTRKMTLGFDLMKDYKIKIPTIFFLFIFSFSFINLTYAQPATPAGFIANPVASASTVFLACGPNNVGTGNIVYRLFYSPTATAPADPLTATQYTFGSTPGDGNGTAAFGFNLTGLTPPGTGYTFWLYQYNTVTMQYSVAPAIAVQTSGVAGPPATPAGFVANTSGGSGQVF